jgi:hypothetical protein
MLPRNTSRFAHATEIYRPVASLAVNLSLNTNSRNKLRIESAVLRLPPGVTQTVKTQLTVR